MFDQKLVDVANQLVANCREGREREGLETLYAGDAVSVEAAPMPGTDSAAIRGVEGIKGKHDWWDGAMEVHSAEVTGPFLHGDDRFAVIFEVDATERESGRRNRMHEVAIYTVKDGKIVREEFYYSV